MINKIINYKTIFVLYLMISPNLLPYNVQAFQEYTHKMVNQRAIAATAITTKEYNVNDYFEKKLGLIYGLNEPLDYVYSFRSWTFQPITAEQIIINGGALEDISPRYFRHFHDAINNYGLWDYFPSALIWAQSPIGGSGYSWNDARHFYYAALTGTESYSRNANFARAFRSLGQVMHLVADMAVPEHTRNDSHPFSPGIESYIEERLGDNPTSFNNALGRPYFFDFKTLQTTASAFAAQGAPIPIANLFDRDIYLGINPDDTTSNNIGLSEYSNANFLSTDTNPVAINIAIAPLLANTRLQVFEISHPLNPLKKIHRWYHVKDRDGETAGGNGYKLSAMRVLSYYRYQILGIPFTTQLPLLDDEVYEDYAKLLLPRAVGYAGTAINYFFRGDIELGLPDQGHYALSTGDGQGFNHIRVRARNVTANNERMSNGSVELVVKFRTALQDPFQGTPVPVSEYFSYIVAPEANGITSIPNNNFVDLTFNLPEILPFNSTDVTLQVVYRGELGFSSSSGFVGETEGVGVGFLDISEPTPIDFINSMDVVCFHDEILLAGSEKVLNALDSEGKKISSYIDFYPHNIVNSYLKYSPSTNISYASPANYDVAIPNVQAGHYARHFVLIEPYGKFVIINNQMNLVSPDPRDSFIHMTHRATRFIHLNP